MKTKILDRTHSTLDLGLLTEYNALFEGGQTFHKELRRFAPKLPGESDPNYHYRLSRMRYRGYAGPIVLLFASALLRAPYEIRALSEGDSVDMHPAIEALKTDADGHGMDLIAVAKKAFIDMAIGRVSWLHCEMEDGRLSIEAESPFCVINWQTESDGLEWIVEAETSFKLASPYAEKGTFVRRWHIYDEASETMFEAAWPDDESEPEEAQQISTERHGFLQCPFVPVCAPPGMWLMGILGDVQRRIFEISNAFDSALNGAAYPTAVHEKHDPKSEPKITPGGLAEIGPNEKLYWIAPPAAPFDALSNREKMLIQELGRLAAQMAYGVDSNAPAALGRSAESKAADQQSTIVCLREFGRVIREALQVALQICADGIGFDAQISVEGFSEFSDDSISELVAALKEITELGINSPRLKAELQKSLAKKLLPGAASSVMDAIQKDLDAPMAGDSTPLT